MKADYTYHYKHFVFESYSQKPTHRHNLIELKQVHSREIISYDKTNQEADGLFFSSKQLKEITPAIKTADCLPIWLVGKRNQYLIHAGWRGLVNNILSHPEILSDSIEFALIGPSISTDNFEVQADFKEYGLPELCFQQTDSKLTFNLQLCAKLQIENLFPLAQIEVSELCTYDSPNLHSYRENKTQSRNWSIVRSLAKINE